MKPDLRQIQLCSRSVNLLHSAASLNGDDSQWRWFCCFQPSHASIAMAMDSLVSRTMDMQSCSHFFRSFATSLLVGGFHLGLSRALHWRWHLPGGVAADNAVEVPCLREAHSKSRCVRCLQCPALLKIFTFAPGAIFTSNSWVRSQEAGDRP